MSAPRSLLILTSGCPLRTISTSGSSASTTLRHSGGIGSNGKTARSSLPLRRSSKRSPLIPMISSLRPGACSSTALSAGNTKARMPLSAAAIRKVRSMPAGSNTAGAESASSCRSTASTAGCRARMRAVGTILGPLRTKSSSPKNARAAASVRLTVAVEVPSSLPVSVRLRVRDKEASVRSTPLSGSVSFPAKVLILLICWSSARREGRSSLYFDTSATAESAPLQFA